MSLYYDDKRCMLNYLCAKVIVKQSAEIPVNMIKE